MKEKRVKPIIILKSVLVLAVAYVIIAGLFVYFSKERENRIIQKTASIIPYPAVISNAGFITVKKLDGQLGSARKFYESQDFSKIGMRVDFSTEDGKKRLRIKEKDVLNKLIDDLIIKKEAEKRGLEVTKDLVDQEVDRKLKEYGTGDYLKNNLEKLYGWDLDDFKENIVKPDLYQEKLSVEVRKADSSYEEAQRKIEEAKNDLSKGLSFSSAAQKYSKGESAKNGGALGWFSANQMLPEVARAIFSLEKNQNSEIIESSIGFHIIRVEDKKIQNEENMFKISQIFIPTKNFFEWLEEIKKDYKVFIPFRMFFWNKESGQAQFREQSLVNYESDLLKNKINDPSIIF